MITTKHVTVLIVIALFIVIGLILFRENGKTETFVCSSKDYEPRLCVIDLFDRHLKRNPTPREITRYSELKDKSSIQERMKKDFPDDFEDEVVEKPPPPKESPLDKLKNDIKIGQKRQSDPEGYKKEKEKEEKEKKEKEKKEKKEKEEKEKLGKNEKNDDIEDESDDESDDEETDDETDNEETPNKKEVLKNTDMKDKSSKPLEKMNNPSQNKQNIQNKDNIVVSTKYLRDMQKHLSLTIQTMDTMIMNAK